jgi:hypothetical protein
VTALLPASVRILVHAALIASTIANTFAHHHRPCRPALPPSTLPCGVRAGGGRRYVIGDGLSSATLMGPPERLPATN